MSAAVAIIPARGGSTRLPRKNILPLAGKPVIAYSIQTALDSGLFAAVIVTTDDAEIAMVALQAGAMVTWREPDDGTKGTQQVAADVLRKMPGIDEACVIYPCAPLLQVDDLRELQARSQHDGGFCFTVGTEPLCDAGAAYWGPAKLFASGVSLYARAAMLPLPPERVCDVNTADDFAAAERLYAKLHPQQTIPAAGPVANVIPSGA